MSLYTCKSHINNINNAPLLASENIKLYNHRICTISGVNPARCYVLCRFKQPDCKSFNYDVQGKQCQFSNGTAEEYPSDVRAEADVNYFDLKKKVGEQKYVFRKKERKKEIEEILNTVIFKYFGQKAKQKCVNIPN